MKEQLKKMGLRPGMVVALEGPPIYLADMPAAVHRFGYEIVRRLAGDVEAVGARPEHWVLFDEIHGVEREEARRAYQQLLSETFPPHQLVMEGVLIEEARMLLSHLPRKKIDWAGGDSKMSRLKPCTVPRAWGLGNLNPQLTNHDGVPICTLLDGAFNMRKQADLSIVVHPAEMWVRGEMVDFRGQQAGVLAALQLRRVCGQQRPELPWQCGVVHIWIDEHGNMLSQHHSRIHKGQLWTSAV